ncbi:hypothetical protein [Microbacterium suwonense]|uniref:hypothetical protein n=1 Tax=Microbacterium suwonense TaxID=683047 RepID=UPI0033059AAE
MSESRRRRQPVARHGQLRSPGATGQLLKLIGIAMAVVLVSGLGVAGFVVGGLLGTVSANAVELDGQKELLPTSPPGRAVSTSCSPVWTPASRSTRTCSKSAAPARTRTAP